MNSETVWEFNTARLSVKLNLTRDRRFRYDGTDDDGEIQAKLDRGDYIAFDSELVVELDGEEIAADYLGGSVYSWSNVHDFYTGHRDPDPMRRACSLNPRNIGHYFPDMVREACKEARAKLAKLGTIRVRNA